MNSFNLNCLPKTPSPNTVTLGVRASSYEFGGHNPVNNTGLSVPGLLTGTPRTASCLLLGSALPSLRSPSFDTPPLRPGGGWAGQFPPLGRGHLYPSETLSSAWCFPRLPPIRPSGLAGTLLDLHAISARLLQSPRLGQNFLL